MRNNPCLCVALILLASSCFVKVKVRPKYGHITLRKELLAGYLTPSLDIFSFSDFSKQQLEIIYTARANPGFYLGGLHHQEMTLTSCLVLFCLFVCCCCFCRILLIELQVLSRGGGGTHPLHPSTRFPHPAPKPTS